MQVQERLTAAAVAQWTGIVTSIAIEMLELGLVEAVVCVQNDENDRFKPRPVGSLSLPTQAFGTLSISHAFVWPGPLLPVIASAARQGGGSLLAHVELPGAAFGTYYMRYFALLPGPRHACAVRCVRLGSAAGSLCIPQDFVHKLAPCALGRAAGHVNLGAEPDGHPPADSESQGNRSPQVVARSRADIMAARGVKPTLSPNLDVLATVEALGVKKLLFIGVGCQV